MPTTYIGNNIPKSLSVLHCSGQDDLNVLALLPLVNEQNPLSAQQNSTSGDSKDKKNRKSKRGAQYVEQSTTMSPVSETGSEDVVAATTSFQLHDRQQVLQPINKITLSHS